MDKYQYMGTCCKGKQIINFFKAVCDSNRHSILHLVKKNGEMNATDIINKMSLSQPTISHHLKILVDAEVLESRKEGKETYYKINEKIINHCCMGFANDFCPKDKAK
jgi:ArsR family transcriptional regulator, arsenate/arsenite/antimonite-responsive transcriptional repressor